MDRWEGGGRSGVLMEDLGKFLNFWWSDRSPFAVGECDEEGLLVVALFLFGLGKFVSRGAG